MSTAYIPNRHQSITRQEAFDKIGRDALSGGSGMSIDVASSVRVDCGDWCLWMSFYDNTLANVTIYGHQSGDPADWALTVLGIELICEHSDDFPYHEFPVDTKVAEPTYTSGAWCGYVDNGWVYLYNRETDLYYPHLTTEVNDGFDFESWIEEENVDDL